TSACVCVSVVFTVDLANAAVTPPGKPVAAPMPVAPVVAIVMFGAMAVFKHTVGFDDGAAAVLLSVTVIVPVAVTLPQPPVSGMRSEERRVGEGWPLMG